MKRSGLPLLLLTCVLLAACTGSRGFDRGVLSRHLRPEAPVVTDEEIARALAARPQLSPPFALAVYFRPSGTGPYVIGQRPWLWAPEDREAVLARLAPLVEAGALSRVVPIADAVVSGDDVRALRLAAARHGADAVLVVSGAGQVDRYSTAASALYWTLVGAFVVPGTRAEALFLASATLWDVRNEYLYAAEESEGTERDTGTPFTVSDVRALAGARRKGMQALGEGIAQRLRALTATSGPVTP